MTQDAFLSTEVVSITVIVPFRNEGAHLSDLVHDLKQQTTNGNFEVIWVDDHSSDHSCDVLQTFVSNSTNWLLLKLPQNQQGKKAALTAGITRASGDIVVTTDADVRIPPGWLKAISSAFNVQQMDMLVLPLRIEFEKRKAIEYFQVAENLAIQGLSFGLAALKMPIGCNGANLAFRRSAFEKVGGYSMHQHTASGDDVLLMQSFLKNGFYVTPLWIKEVLVTAFAEPSGKSAIKQRVRWAGKTGRMIFSMAAMVGSVLLLHSVLLAVGWSFESDAWKLWFFLLALKVVVDVLLINTVGKHYQQRLKPLKLIFISIAYAVYLPLITFVSAVWKPTWKERKT